MSSREKRDYLVNAITGFVLVGAIDLVEPLSEQRVPRGGGDRTGAGQVRGPLPAAGAARHPAARHPTARHCQPGHHQGRLGLSGHHCGWLH